MAKCSTRDEHAPEKAGAFQTTLCPDHRSRVPHTSLVFALSPYALSFRSSSKGGSFRSRNPFTKIVQKMSHLLLPSSQGSSEISLVQISCFRSAYVGGAR